MAANVTTTVNCPVTNNYSISYTNNISTQQVAVFIGNNNSSPSNTVYNGTYSSDPLTGTNANLPAVNAIVVLSVPGKTIVSATCNGVTITPNASTATWTGVNGPLIISFITSGGGSFNPITLSIGNSEFDACNAPYNIYYMNTAILQNGSQIYIDAAGAIPISANFVRNGGGAIYNCSINIVGSLTGNSC